MSTFALLPTEPSQAGNSRLGVLRWQDVEILGIQCESADICDAQGRTPAIKRRESRWQRLRRLAAFAAVFTHSELLVSNRRKLKHPIGVSHQSPRLHSPTLHLAARQARQKFNFGPLAGVKQLVRFRFTVAHNDSRSADSAKRSSHRECLRWRGFRMSGWSNPRRRTPNGCPDPDSASITGNGYVPDSDNSAMPSEVQRSVESARFWIAATRH